MQRRAAAADQISDATDAKTTPLHRLHRAHSAAFSLTNEAMQSDAELHRIHRLKRPQFSARCSDASDAPPTGALRPSASGACAPWGARRALGHRR